MCGVKHEAMENRMWDEQQDSEWAACFGRPALRIQKRATPTPLVSHLVQKHCLHQHSHSTGVRDATCGSFLAAILYVAKHTKKTCQDHLQDH